MVCPFPFLWLLEKAFSCLLCFIHYRYPLFKPSNAQNHSSGLSWNSDNVFSKSELTGWKTSHFRQNFIFSSQFRCAFPWQIVPLINQHKCPVLNSQAGHWYLFSGGQSSTSQQGLTGSSCISFVETKYRIWRSMLVGIFRQPCSKLWTDLREIPKSSAICFCVFLKLWRRETNSLSFTS